MAMARISTAVLTVGIFLCGTGASAQEARPERPYRGLFGGGTDESAHVITASGSVGSGYDTSAATAAAESGLLIPVADVTSGSMYSNLSGALSYSARLEKFSAGASLSSSIRHYPQLDVPMTPSHAASSSINLALGKNTRVTAGAGMSYQETRGFTPFPELGEPILGQVSAPSPDYGTGRVDYATYNVSAGLNQQLSRRSSLTMNYDRQTSQRTSGIEDLGRQSGSFRFTHSLGRYLGLRLGYGYTEARYGVTAQKYENHNLDTGVDYNRDLSLTRRTRLAFTSGATGVRQGQTTRYDVIGSARLSREIGRTWSADLSYQRSVGFIDSVAAPTFYDGLNAGIGGLISRRLSFRAGAGATRGSIGVTETPANGFGAWTGSAGLNAAVTRNLALGINYMLYHYNFEDGAAAVTGLLPRTNRHSVSVTLNAWAAVFQHGKRTSNASR
jgi:hypothetical protein